MPTKKQLEKFKHPFMATDIIIEYYDGKKQGIVLIERKNPPYGLAIPGGFAEVGISLEENAIKEAKEETSLDVILENPEHPLCIKSQPNRDPRNHVMSVVYIAIGQGKLEARDDAKEAYLYSIDEVISLLDKNNVLAFDHKDILQEYLEYRGMRYEHKTN